MFCAVPCTSMGTMGIAPISTLPQVGADKNDGLWRVSAAQVQRAVESLYADRLQPLGRLLLKRLGELAVSAEVGPAAFAGLCMQGMPVGVVPRIDRAHLRKVCETTGSFRVVPGENGEYSVFLVDRATDFVDAGEPQDLYPVGMWQSMRFFFAVAGAGLRLPGGRYACALALSAMSPPFLAARCLGEVSHIVQLAIAEKHILGYADGFVVPHEHSDMVLRQQCAALQKPVTTTKPDPSGPRVASLAQARACLQEIIGLVPGCDPCEVPLPNVKRLFRSRFQLVLSETALGHTRLCDLLRSSSFSDLCVLRPQGSGYVVVPCDRAQAAGDAESRGRDVERRAASPEAAPTPLLAPPEQGSRSSSMCSAGDPGLGCCGGGSMSTSPALHASRLLVVPPLEFGDDHAIGANTPVASPFRLMTPSPMVSWQPGAHAPPTIVANSATSPKIFADVAPSNVEERMHWELCQALGVGPDAWRCEVVGQVLDDSAAGESEARSQHAQPNRPAFDGLSGLEEMEGTLEFAHATATPLLTPSPAYDWLSIVKAYAPVPSSFRDASEGSTGLALSEAGLGGSAATTPRGETSEGAPSPWRTGDLDLEKLEDHMPEGMYVATPSPFFDRQAHVLSAVSVRQADALAPAVGPAHGGLLGYSPYCAARAFIPHTWSCAR